MPPLPLQVPEWPYKRPFVNVTLSQQEIEVRAGPGTPLGGRVLGMARGPALVALPPFWGPGDRQQMQEGVALGKQLRQGHYVARAAAALAVAATQSLRARRLGAALNPPLPHPLAAARRRTWR